MTVFKMQRDVNQENSFLLPLSDKIFRVKIPANTTISLSIPLAPNGEYYKMAIVTASDNFMVSKETFTIGSSPTFEECVEEMNKPGFPLDLGNSGSQITELFFAARTECDIYVSLFEMYIRPKNPLG